MDFKSVNGSTPEEYSRVVAVNMRVLLVDLTQDGWKDVRGVLKELLLTLLMSYSWFWKDLLGVSGVLEGRILGEISMQFSCFLSSLKKNLQQLVSRLGLKNSFEGVNFLIIFY
jgi:hypothetical protein